MVETKSKAVVEFKFAPIEEFEWRREFKDEDGNVIDSALIGPDHIGNTLIGRYHIGNTYNCTLKPAHDALRLKCVEWEAAGKIKIMNLEKGQVFKTVKVS